jgi:predicted Zn-dependent peptidase
LTYAVDASLGLYADAGVLAIDLAVSPENLEQAVTAILDILTELHAAEVAREELGHVLDCYRYDLEYSRDQVDEMALRYAWGELVDCRRTIAGDLAGLDRVSASGLRQTIGQLLTPGNLRGAIIGPYRSQDRKAAEKLIDAWQPGRAQ